MIEIDVTEPGDDDWRAWLRDCAQEQYELNTAIQNGVTREIKSVLYRAMKGRFYLAPDGPFHGKCAFCESEIYSNQHGDLDHYRPKGGVSGPDGPVKIAGTGQNHPGYYWLAYDWRNLLPTCQLCNQPNKQRSGGKRIGKWTSFPLKDETTRAIRPGDEKNEDPLLINPTVDDPADHLQLDSVTLVYSAKNGSLKGQPSIDILGLNDRELPVLRRAVYETTYMQTLTSMQYIAVDLSRAVEPAMAGRACSEAISKLTNPDMPFLNAARLAVARARKLFRESMFAGGCLDSPD